MKYPVAPLKEKYIKLECCTAVILNAMLFVLKYWAGIVTGSLALLADAWHTLSDWWIKLTRDMTLVEAHEICTRI